jgi:hypothetical protein
MPLYEFAKEGIYELDSTTFAKEGFRERYDVQRLLREKIDVIAPDTLVIAEEFNGFVDSYRSIDLLAIDKKANLVVIELKRTDDGGHMELQAIRYAAMVSTLTFDQAAGYFQDYLNKIAKIGRESEDSRKLILDFLGWDAVYNEDFAQNVKIILASSNFGQEITSTVLWLIDQGIDIRCVRMQPYKFGDRIIVDVQQIIPLPEAEEYQVKIQEKNRQERKSFGESKKDYTKYDVEVCNTKFLNNTKRDAIFNLVKTIVNSGVAIDNISEVIGGGYWYDVDGELRSDDFRERALEKAAAGGRSFDTRKWFSSEDRLFYQNGRTYAFSNQWGSGNWPAAMDALRENFSSFGVNYKQSDLDTAN